MKQLTVLTMNSVDIDQLKVKLSSTCVDNLKKIIEKVEVIQASSTEVELQQGLIDLYSVVTKYKVELDNCRSEIILKYNKP